MKSEAAVKNILIIAIVIQWYTFYTQELCDLELPFSTALEAADTVSGEITSVLYSVIPIPFILWMFAGDMEGLTKGVGILYIIRQYDRKKLLLRFVFRMILCNGGITGGMWVLFTAGKKDTWHSLDQKTQIKILILYWLVLVCSVLLEYFIELFLPSQYAHLIVLGYFVCCCAAYPGVITENSRLLYKFLCFPALAFAHYNGALESDLSAVDSMGLCLLAAVILLAASGAKLQKKDMI